MIHEFDLFEFNENHKYMLCNNILPKDLIGTNHESALTLHEHPYVIFREFLPSPMFTLQIPNTVYYNKTLLWNKLKLYVPKHFIETFSFNWKKEWLNFYKECESINKEYSNQVFNTALVYIKQQNIYPQFIKNGNIIQVVYSPIVLYSELSNINFMELVKAITDIIKTLKSGKNDYQKKLFEDMSFDNNNEKDLSFISYCLNFFRIISMGYNNLTLYEKYQLDYLSKDLTDIDSLKYLGIKQNSTEPELIMEANMVKESDNLFDTIWEFKWKVVIGNIEYSEKDFKELVNSKNETIKKVNMKIISDIIKKMKEKPNMKHGEILRNYLLNKIQINKGKDFLNNLNRQIDYNINVKTKLRNYQETGIKWMISNLLNGFGVILADEMGLGKTLQAIAVLCYLTEHNLISRTLIVCPAILQLTWMREFQHHSNLKAIQLENFKNESIVITSYEMFTSRQSKDKLGFDFDCIILDEAQKVKNPSTKAWKVLQDINPKYRIVITGTPMENNMMDIWALMQIIFPGYLGSKTLFLKEDPSKIKKCIEPFILRRKKVDCAIELPNKIETVRFVNLTVEQAALYQKCLDNEKENLKNNVTKFKLATHLKMICNHPSSYSKEINISSESNKWNFVKDFIPNLEDNKLVIFTQYIEMGKILQSLIKKEFNMKVDFLSGEDSIQTRQKKIDSFQNNNESQVIIISIRTGGSGITLTRASYVIMYDLWWNPAVVEQAIDRTHRIGQFKHVQVYLLVTKGTIEEKIFNMLQKKKNLIDNLIQSNETWLAKMTSSEIIDLFSLN